MAKDGSNHNEHLVHVGPEANRDLQGAQLPAGASTSGLVRRMIGANSTDTDAFYWGRSRAALAGKARGGEGRQAGRRLP